MLRADCEHRACLKQRQGRGRDSAKHSVFATRKREVRKQMFGCNALSRFLLASFLCRRSCFAQLACICLERGLLVVFSLQHFVERVLGRHAVYIVLEKLPNDRPHRSARNPVDADHPFRLERDAAGQPRAHR